MYTGLIYIATNINNIVDAVFFIYQWGILFINKGHNYA